jgi:hypothetical protein
VSDACYFHCKFSLLFFVKGHPESGGMGQLYDGIPSREYRCDQHSKDSLTAKFGMKNV